MIKITTYNETLDKFVAYELDGNYYINKDGRFTSDSTDAVYQFHSLPILETIENMKLTFAHQAFGNFDAIVYADYITKL